MLDYEWANPPPIMLNDAVSITVDEPNPQPDHHTNLHYSQTFTQPTTNNTLYFDPNDFQYHTHNPTHHYQPNPTHFTSLYNNGYSFEPDGPTGLNGLTTQTGFMFMPKAEPDPVSNNRIGLNLGGRTYFSSAEDELVNRLYGRSRAVEPAAYVSVPRCQVEGCNADLTHAKHYHRRHKVCEFHSKASTVIAAGLTQRFCQQCSRFHLLLEFDNGKRSCRRRLADHNRRRRKSSQYQDHIKSLITVTSTPSSSSDITLKYEPDSRG